MTLTDVGIEEMRAVIGDCRSWSCEAVTIERLSDYQLERVECEEEEAESMQKQSEKIFKCELSALIPC